MAKIRVLVADDHAVVRKGLILLLEADEGIEVVGEAADGLQAIERTEALKPDLVLMDISMPNLNGLEAARQIKKRFPQVAVLFLTMYDSEEYLFQALQSGGSGYVPKSAPESEVITAIKAVGQGLAYLYPTAAQKLVSDYLSRVKAGESADPYHSLTDREKEILQLIAQGMSTKDIAERLSLSVHTVHNHRANIMEKLGLHSRLELLRYAIRKGLIPPEP